MRRLLVAGAGLIGLRHIQEVLENPRCDLAGIVEPDTQKASQFGVPVFAALDDVNAKADGIILATPTGLHADQTIVTLQRGWHVLVEKPLAGTSTDTARICEAAARSPHKVLVGHHRRHHPRIAELKALIEAGEIGRPLAASCLWTVRKPDSYFKGNWRDGPDGSPILINAVHDIDLMRFLFGEIAGVSAAGSNVVRGAPRVETAAILLRFENGFVATIVLSDAAPAPWSFEVGTGENPHIGKTGQDMMFIAGSKGAVSFPSLTIWQGSNDWSVAPRPHIWPYADRNGEQRPLARQLNHFLDVMDGICAPIIDAQDAARTLEDTLAAEDQIREQGFPG